MAVAIVMQKDVAVTCFLGGAKCFQYPGVYM